jgi:hypothetical protein
MCETVLHITDHFESTALTTVQDPCGWHPWSAETSSRGFCASSSSSIDTTTLSWVSAYSTIVEHSQQEGFTECRCQRHVKPQLGGEPGI